MQKQGYVLTGGAYKGCSDDVLIESKLMVDLGVVELDTMDRLSFIPGNFWLVRGVSRISRYVTGWYINTQTLCMENTELRKFMGKEGE